MSILEFDARPRPGPSRRQKVTVGTNQSGQNIPSTVVRRLVGGLSFHIEYSFDEKASCVDILFASGTGIGTRAMVCFVVARRFRWLCTHVLSFLLHCLQRKSVQCQIRQVCLVTISRSKGLECLEKWLSASMHWVWCLAHGMRDLAVVNSVFLCLFTLTFSTRSSISLLCK